MLLRDSVELFLDFRKSYCAIATVIYYRDCLERFLDFELSSGKTCVEDVGRGDLIDYQRFLRGASLKNVSVNTYVRGIKVWAIENDVLLDMPRRCREDAAQIVVLTGEEVQLLDAVIEEYSFRVRLSDSVRFELYVLRNWLLFHLMLDEGLRRREVISLTVSSVHLEDRYLVIHKGKYDKDRILPLAENVRHRLCRYCDLLGQVVELRENTPLFYDLYFNAPISFNAVKQFFEKLKFRSGIDRVHPHLLRHTFATAYILQGGDVSILQILLGHSDIAVTQKYLHLAYQIGVAGLDVYRLDSYMLRR